MGALNLTHHPALFPWEQRRVGSYYGPFGADGAFNAFGAAANVLWAMPFWSGLRGTYDRIGVQVTGSSPASSLRVGVYESDFTDPASPVPGALVVDSGVLSGAAVAFVQSVIAITLAPRSLFWLVYTTNDAAVIIRSTTGTPWWGYDGVAETFFSAFTVARAFAALPAAFPAGGAPSILTIAHLFIVLRSS